MKKIAILITVILVTLSCEANLVSSSIDAFVYAELENVELYDFAEYDISWINCTGDAGFFIRDNVRYQADIGEEYISPEESLARGYDDCDGFYFLFANLMYLATGEKYDMAVVEIPIVRTVVEGGPHGNHIFAYRDGQLYEPITGGRRNDRTIYYIYTFDEIFGGLNEND